MTLSARIPVCGENYKHLAGIALFAASFGISKISAAIPDGYFFEGEEFDNSLFEHQLETAAALGREKGFTFSFNRFSNGYRAVSETAERRSPCFYPRFYVGRRRRPEILEAILRPAFSCNQICKFCWVDTQQANPSPQRIESEIRHIINKRIPKLGISGGEPTLVKELVKYIEIAKSGGLRQVELHTNAVRLADKSLCRDLKNAGLDMAYCTLLATEAKLSDDITRTAGTFRKTVTGIINLMEAGVHTAAHFVIMEDNYRILPGFVKFADENFTYGDKRLAITFSYVAPRDAKAVSDGIVPRFTNVMPYLDQALRECVSRRIPFCAGEGLKGMPPCVVPFRERYLKQFLPPSRNVTGGAFVKKENCAVCAYDGVCFGVRRYYAGHYGLDEISPVTGGGEKPARLERE